MNTFPGIEVQAALKYFSVACFHRAWELIELADRSPEEDEEMVRLSQASLWHWTQREDCIPKNLSIGYWQLARIHTLLGQYETALRYGRLSLEHSRGTEPVYEAYAYEALARAAAGAGSEEVGAYLDEARKLAGKVTDAEEREAIDKDLATIRTGPP